MLTWHKRYQVCISRIMLLAGYLFLFAGQFNGHYFGIANFYVFEQQAGAAGPQKALSAIGLILLDNSHQPAHLAVDKRFHFKQSVRVAQIHALRTCYCEFIFRRVVMPPPAYSSAHLPTNGLRGPPVV